MPVLKWWNGDKWLPLYIDKINNKLDKDKNLSDLVSIEEARSNLGLIGNNNETHFHDQRYHTKEVFEAVYLVLINNKLDKDKNLSDLTDPSQARMNMGLIGNTNDTHFHDQRYYRKDEFQSGAINNSPVIRDENGRFRASAPAEATQVARKQEVDNVQNSLNTHSADAVRHITAAERTAWNAKSDARNAAQVATGAMAYNSHVRATGTMYGGATAPAATTRLNYDGYFYATRVYNAVYNDYAEFFLKGEYLEPGDIVSLITDADEEIYGKSRGEFDNFVIGVLSDDYAQCIGGEGAEDDHEKYAPIGLAGRVRVKVIGKVNKGDFIVSSSIPGVGMAISPKDYTPGTAIGKALEDYDGKDGIVRVRMLVQNC